MQRCSHLLFKKTAIRRNLNFGELLLAVSVGSAPCKWVLAFLEALKGFPCQNPHIYIYRCKDSIETNATWPSSQVC